MNSSRRVLLLGAGGFVGPWIARALRDQGFAVTGLTRRSVPAEPRVHFVTCDITVPGAVRNWVEKADAVIFNAAYIPKNYADPSEAQACLRTNALAVLDVLAAKPPAFVYISTGQGYLPVAGLARESDAIFPAARATYYLGSKLLGELYTEHYRLQHQIPAAILRLGALYGPSLQTGMIATFMRELAGGNSVLLQDGGRFSSDLTYVEDIGAAVTETLESGAAGIFNIGSGRATSALKAARVVAQVIGAADALITVAPARAGLPSGFAALDITRAREKLGFVPTSLEQGLAATWANRREDERG
jgi:UDP-glucose 4-epimerase